MNRPAEANPCPTTPGAGASDEYEAAGLDGHVSVWGRQVFRSELAGTQEGAQASWFSWIELGSFADWVLRRYLE